MSLEDDLPGVVLGGVKGPIALGRLLANVENSAGVVTPNYKKLKRIEYELSFVFIYKSHIKFGMIYEYSIKNCNDLRSNIIVSCLNNCCIGAAPRNKTQLERRDAHINRHVIFARLFTNKTRQTEKALQKYIRSKTV